MVPEKESIPEVRSPSADVRVPSGKQFYLYILQTIDRAEARIGGAGAPFALTNDVTDAEPARPDSLAAKAPHEIQSQVTP